MYVIGQILWSILGLAAGYAARTSLGPGPKDDPR